MVCELIGRKSLYVLTTRVNGLKCRGLKGVPKLSSLQGYLGMLILVEPVFEELKCCLTPFLFRESKVTVSKLEVKQKGELNELLDSFGDAFKDPQGLPPRRQHEHDIHLIEGSGVVNVRLYRYPYHHKATIEKQVKEML